MAQQGEEAAPLLVVPHLDLVVVAAADKQGLGGVEVHAAHGACTHTGGVGWGVTWQGGQGEVGGSNSSNSSAWPTFAGYSNCLPACQRLQPLLG